MNIFYTCMATTKKLINSVDSCVEESLLGFAATHPLTKKLKGYRVIIRADIDEFKSQNKVALVCGGGSGHEPLFAGFVGKGCLTASIAGSVFTSPPPKQILAAINASQTSTGVVVFIPNYTGDRLNIGIAIQRFHEIMPNVPVIPVIVADDCALTSADKSAGRRGLSGIVLVIKMCGAMSEECKTPAEIADTAKLVVDNLGTIGLSLSSCSLPGQGVIFSLSSDEMELGLGVHGEPGVKRMKLQSAKEAVNSMLCHLVKPDSATSLKLANGNSVAVLVNNLGGMTQLEINLLCHEVILWFEEKEIYIKRFYAGTFNTSLEMQGFSISVLRLVCEDWIALLDSNTNCSAWPSFQQLDSSYLFSVKSVERDIKCDVHEHDIKHSTHDNSKEANQNRDILLSICESLIDNENLLNDLDKSCGDGDCGSTMKNGASAIKQCILQNKLPFVDSSTMLNEMSEIWENNTGGTAGAIYSLLLSAASKSLKNDSSFNGWLNALIESTSVIMSYGGAEPGDRTMVDALIAAVKVANTQLNSKKPNSKQFCIDLMKAVEDAAESTKSMIAKAGRASYVAKSNLTLPDPGAAAVAIWIKAIGTYFCNDL